MNKAQKQNVMVILVAVGVVVISALVTAAFTLGVFNGGSDENQSYQNVTFTDATLTCEKEVRDDFGSSLDQLVTDNHSSRFDHSVSLYKIFFKAYTKRKNKTIEFFVTCYVKARNGRIEKYESFENRDSPKGEVIKKGSDKFIEWPQ